MLLIPNATNDWTKSWFFSPHYIQEISKVVYKKTLSCKYDGETWCNPVRCCMHLLNIHSGVASIGARGQSAPLTAKKSSKIGKKREKIWKKREKIGEKRKNREEKVKIRKVLSFCPSWQIGLATLLCIWGFHAAYIWQKCSCKLHNFEQWFSGKKKKTLDFVQLLMVFGIINICCWPKVMYISAKILSLQRLLFVKLICELVFFSDKIPC